MSNKMVLVVVPVEKQEAEVLVRDLINSGYPSSMYENEKSLMEFLGYFPADVELATIGSDYDEWTSVIDGIIANPASRTSDKNSVRLLGYIAKTLIDLVRIQKGILE